MKLLFFVLISFSCIFNSYAQQGFSAIADQMIHIRDSSSAEQALKHIDLFEGKDFHKLDIETLKQSPFLGMELFHALNNEEPYTYQNLYDAFLEHKTTEQYAEFKQDFITNFELERFYVADENWEKASSILKHTDMSESEIDLFKKYTHSNQLDSISYKEAVFRFKKEHYKSKPNIFSVVHTINLDSLLLQSAEQQKLILLNFAGHSCANSHKLHQTLNDNQAISTLINEHFILVNLYCDDRSPLPENQHYYSDELEIDIKTIGQKNSDFMVSRFNLLSQPYLVILNSNDEELGSIGYSQGTQQFEDMLKKAIESQE